MSALGDKPSKIAGHGGRRLLCRLGIHTVERSQGIVGYCLRDGCDDLKRVHVGRNGWTRYVQRPTQPLSTTSRHDADA